MARGTGSTESTVRLMNLVALLTAAKTPMTIDQIAMEMNLLEPQYRYPEGVEARRTMFNRDKKALIELGIGIVTSTLSGQDAGVGAYIIDKESYSLIDFGLTRDEMEALQLAAAVVQIEQPWGRQAVQWLGGAVEEPPTGAVAHVGTGAPALTALFAAVRGRSVVTFSYHGRSRVVHPYGLVSRNGFWYLVGFDTGHQSQRTFRVDRIQGNITAGNPSSFERPEGFEIETAIPSDPKRYPGGEDEHAIVRIHPNLAGAVVHELGPESVVRTNADGTTDVRVPCGNHVAFRSWLFSMVDRAVVVEPAHLRDRILNELETMAGRS